MTVSGKRILPAALGLLIMVVVSISALPSGHALAGQITSRSLLLEANGSNGGSAPNVNVNHKFTFTFPNTGAATIKSISFTYCTKARDVSCAEPTGMVTASATLGTLTGLSGWTLTATTEGSPYITSGSGTSSTNVTASVELVTVHNPTAANTAFYTEIQTFTSTNATGSPVDVGWVAASTANQIALSGTMPESLIFCTGDAISLTSGVPDCSTATNNTVTFNQLFSPTDTATATSKMAASTNAQSGYVITVNGATLTSGSNTVTAMGTAGAGVRGTSQFGMNLVANTTTTSTPAVGAAITPASNGTNYRGEPVPSSGYDVADSFKFTSGDAIADSAHTVAGGTDSQLYTVSYIVNVNGAQAAGTYTTTLTYICTPTF